MFENSLETKIGELIKVRNLNLNMCLTWTQELGSHVSHCFITYKRPFSTPIQDMDYIQGLQSLLLIGVENGRF